MPTLILDDGEPIFDSSVICDYLEVVGGALIPSGGAERRKAP
jgi:glutathione S-transferase